MKDSIRRAILGQGVFFTSIAGGAIPNPLAILLRGLDEQHRAYSEISTNRYVFSALTSLEKDEKFDPRNYSHIDSDSVRRKVIRLNTSLDLLELDDSGIMSRLIVANASVNNAVEEIFLNFDNLGGNEAAEFVAILHNQSEFNESILTLFSSKPDVAKEVLASLKKTNEILDAVSEPVKELASRKVVESLLSEATMHQAAFVKSTNSLINGNKAIKGIYADLGSVKFDRADLADRLWREIRQDVNTFNLYIQSLDHLKRSHTSIERLAELPFPAAKSSYHEAQAAKCVATQNENVEFMEPLVEADSRNAPLVGQLSFDVLAAKYLPEQYTSDSNDGILPETERQRLVQNSLGV